MIQFLHTADWQFGMRAKHVSRAATRVREARIETLRRVARLARQRQVDFTLITGDLFEDNHVNDRLVQTVVSELTTFGCPVYILPGNHDRLDAGSVYARPVWQTAPANVVVLTENTPVECAGGKAILLPAPITQRWSGHDPTLQIHRQPEVSVPIVGVAHGSLEIEGRYNADDHPIGLDAADRLGADYLALGHWHSFYQHDDATVYCGTPEPTAFDERDSGNVAMVRVAGRGHIPEVEKIPVAALRWETWDEESGSHLVSHLRQRIEGIDFPERCLIRVRVRGGAEPELFNALDDLAEWAQERLLYFDVDRSRMRPALQRGQLELLARSHPLVGGLLQDLAGLQRLAGVHDSQSEEAAAAREDDLDLDHLLQVLQDLAGSQSDGLTEARMVVEEAAQLLAVVAGEVWR